MNGKCRVNNLKIKCSSLATKQQLIAVQIPRITTHLMARVQKLLKRIMRDSQ